MARKNAATDVSEQIEAETTDNAEANEVKIDNEVTVGETVGLTDDTGDTQDSEVAADSGAPISSVPLVPESPLNQQKADFTEAAKVEVLNTEIDMDANHKLQTGEADALPNGVSIKEYQEAMIAEQNRQEELRKNSDNQGENIAAVFNAA